MTANLTNLTPENIRLIQDITIIGVEMGLDSTLINAAINIANAESSLRYDAQASTSTAWGPFQYLDASWTTGWNRLVRDQNDVGITVDSSLTADGTRNSHEWQIRVALNEFRNYYDGYPDVIASSWQDDVQSLVDRGYHPDTIFLEYAYLRHNTDSSAGGQVETVYSRDFTVDNIEYVNALGSANQLMVSIVGADEEIAISNMRVYRDADGNVMVNVEYNGGAVVLRHDGQSPDQITLNPRTGQITATYSDGTSNDFTRVGDEIFENCFLAGTMIDMWPTDLGIRPNIDGCYDETAVRAKIWKKPIEEVTPNDWVVSFDKQGNLKPGKVTRTMTNEAKVILDFHGTFVTPGHVYYCAGGKYEGGFAPLIDILRDDGVIQHEDGTLIRANTGCEVGSEDDKEFWAFLLYTEEGEDVNRVRAKTKLRLGTRWMQPNGSHFSMREYMDGIGLELLDNGYVRWKETGITSVFAWVLSDTLPEPEDFILARSQTTLEDIYRAGQWEDMRPQMPVPLVMDGGPVQPLPEHKLDMMPRNTPMATHANAPSSGIVASQPKMNRKQRKAQEAK